METPEGLPAMGLCLDFSDTVDWRNGKSGKTPVDNLKDYDSLVEWSRDHGLVRAEEAKSLGRIAKESGKDKSIFRLAIELREIIYRVFSATTHGRKPSDRDLEALNDFLSESMAKSRIVRRGEAFRWSYFGTEGAPDRMLWPIARSAAELLTSELLANVRECANEEEGCGWLFLDESKSHTRRWCSMKGCGNVAKARRYYERHRESA